MRHRRVTPKLGRTASHRRAMMRNMLTSLFQHEKVVTTEAKAKAVKPMAEKMVTLAKRGDLHARRQALSVLNDKAVTHKLFAEIRDRYMDRAGGYTSVIKLGPRRGDAAPMAVLELLKPEEAQKGKKKPRRKRGGGKKKAETAPAAQPEAKEPTPEPQAAAEPETTPEPEEAAAPETAPAPAPEEAPEAEAAPEEEEKPEKNE